MELILDKLIESLNNGNILVAVVVIFVAIIFNYKNISELFYDKKKEKIIKLNESLLCEHVTGLTKEHLVEELIKEQFKLHTGIGVEKEFREALISEHRNTNGEISFSHFKRALPFIFYENGRILVKLSPFDKAGYFVNLLAGFLMAFLGLLVAVLTSQIHQPTIFQILSMLGLAIFFMFVGFYMLTQTFPFTSAKKLVKHLDRQREN